MKIREDSQNCHRISCWYQCPKQQAVNEGHCRANQVQETIHNTTGKRGRNIKYESILYESILCVCMYVFAKVYSNPYINHIYWGNPLPKYPRLQLNYPIYFAVCKKKSQKHFLPSILKTYTTDNFIFKLHIPIFMYVTCMLCHQSMKVHQR